MQKITSAQLSDSSLMYDDGKSTASPDIPQYLSDTYWWAYLHPRSVRFFEHQWAVNLILWGNFASLRDSALDEMGPIISGRSLQVACVYGDFTPKFAERLAPDARLDVIDVAPIQLDNLRRKIKGNPNVKIALQNASALTYDDQTFDQVVVFFLLHELPSEVRAKTLREVLRVVKPGGKVVCVDYHLPVWMHPHRYLMMPILKTLEPFALDLWDKEIIAWIPDECRPHQIRKSTYFGGLYQKVVMIR